LATLLAWPSASDPPESPEEPESPERALPDVPVMVPRRAVFDEVRLALTLPVAPVLPELPEVATGLEDAELDAGPVVPLFVALVWERADPVSPVMATGAAVAVAEPP